MYYVQRLRLEFSEDSEGKIPNAFSWEKARLWESFKI